MGQEWNIMLELVKTIDKKVDAVQEKVEVVAEKVADVRCEMEELKLHYTTDAKESKIKQQQHSIDIETLKT